MILNMPENNSLEIWPKDIAGAKSGLTVVAISAVLFYIAGLIAVKLTPISADKQIWRWKNISVSLFHSTMSGVGAVLCFVYEPQMAEDLIQTYTTAAHTLISASVGYFVYDTLDMIVYQRSRQTLELLLHHFVIIVCFGIAIFTYFYVGYAILALIVELNTIFLHVRQLLQTCGFSKSNQFYRLNSLINLGTFIIFRIATVAWMTRWIVINKDQVPLAFYTIGSAGLATLTVMNIILFYRLLKSDFLRKKDIHQIKKED